MGTSLNGLTPAGTYPGLIKTGDNAPIDGTLKTLSDGNGNNLPMAVSTTAVNFTNQLQQGGVAVPTASQVNAKQDTLVSGTNIKTINGASLLGSGNIPVVTSPSGVAGAIQFSNGSAFASDASNLFWDDTNNRLGVGTNTPSSALEIMSDAKINGLTVGRGAAGIATNTTFGGNAFIANTTGSANTAVGYQSLDANTTGSANTAVGTNTLSENNTGSNNSAFGHQALVGNTTGNSNSAFGLNSLRDNSTGSNNIAIGVAALQSNATSNNTAVGCDAASSNVSGTGITAIGYQALTNSIGENNTAVGFQAGLNISTGTQNTAVGSLSLSAVSGARNTAVGYSALTSNTGAFNTAVGRQALANNTSGDSNSAIGEGCQSGNFSGSVILGKDATATANNQFVVGSTGTNAGAVTTETITPDTTWTVRINGANYKIPMLAL